MVLYQMYNNFYIHPPTVADPEMEYVQHVLQRKLIQTKFIPKIPTNYLTHLHWRLQNNILAGADLWFGYTELQKKILQYIYNIKSNRNDN